VALGGAVIAGANSVGTTVTDLGLVSTDLLYFASGAIDAAGVMLTASHNPAQYNGMKFCLAGASPIGEESGLFEIRDFAVEVLATLADPLQIGAVNADRRDMLDVFAAHVQSFVDQDVLAPLHVVADTANGMGGLIAPRVFADLPFQLDVLFGELDGTFPNHPADPIQPKTSSLCKKRSSRAAPTSVWRSTETPTASFSSMTRRCHSRDRRQPRSSRRRCLKSTRLNDPVQLHLLEDRPRGDCRARRYRRAHRVGHSFIKGVMAETGALFGGEHSGHYYFRDNYRADSGIVAALVILELLSVAQMPLSELRKPFERYADSGEINTKVHDTAAVVSSVGEHYAAGGLSSITSTVSPLISVIGVQPARLEHRAAAAAERRGERSAELQQARRRSCCLDRRGRSGESRPRRTSGGA